MTLKKQRAERNKQKKELRRKKRAQSRKPAQPTISRRLAELLDDAYDLIDHGHYLEASELLDEFDHDDARPEVVRTLLALHQAKGASESACQAAERLTRLSPRDAEAHFLFAQESMLCGRATIALEHYRECFERWPDHSASAHADKLLGILVPEVERRLKDAEFPEEHAMELLYEHEHSLMLLQQAAFMDCAAACEALIAKAPNFVSARNNLAVALFQAGRVVDAVAVVEETRRLRPENRFAESILGKLYFLTGRHDEAHQLVDQILVNPPTQQDALIATLEMLAILGRDEDVVQLAESAAEQDRFDGYCEAMRLHYLAYGKCRLGDKESAKALWKQCVKLNSQVGEARENLADLKAGEGNAPWAASLAKWIPTATRQAVLDELRGKKNPILDRFPAVAALIPALLDRGDAQGREVAMRLAMTDATPPMLEALSAFAFGGRGTDDVRFQALQFLHQRKVIDAGPHRICIGGEWKEIRLLAAEITNEPLPSDSSPRVQELIEKSVYALQANDFNTAEAALLEALAESPDDCVANYNLCSVWIRRDGSKGMREAIPRIEQLHEKHPDYPFASIALAQFAAQKGKFQQAHELLAPCFQMKRMHVSEAVALFMTQSQIFVAQDDFAGAERAYDMLCKIADEDDPQVLLLREKIDQSMQMMRLKKHMSW
ncbi:MAG: tetratricopeptide repeat protein [Planctomycetales bacterium]|nr:tetratricopeptide repeat protein [Planctomycetales bacterium]